MNPSALRYRKTIELEMSPQNAKNNSNIQNKASQSMNELTGSCARYIAVKCNWNWNIGSDLKHCIMLDFLNDEWVSGVYFVHTISQCIRCINCRLHSWNAQDQFPDLHIIQYTSRISYQNLSPSLQMHQHGTFRRSEFKGWWAPSVSPQQSKASVQDSSKWIFRKWFS